MSVPEVNGRYLVANANFERVLAVIRKNIIQARVTFCPCGKCICIITAEALNLLPTHYYVNKELERSVGSPWILVENAVDEAVAKVQHRLCSRAHSTAG